MKVYAITDIGRVFTLDELRAGVVLRRGKKSYRKVVVK